MLHKAWNSKGEMPYCFPRSSIKFQGHTVQNITDFDPNWAFLDYRPVAAFKSLRFALFFIQNNFLIGCTHYPESSMLLITLMCPLTGCSPWSGVHLVSAQHDDVIKWKHFLRYWPFVRGIHRSPENSPNKGQWRGALIFSLICAWINKSWSW